MCQVVRRMKKGERKLPLTWDKKNNNNHNERKQTTIRWDKNQKNKEKRKRKGKRDKWHVKRRNEECGRKFPTLIKSRER